MSYERVVSIFQHKDFDYPYGECLECGSIDWKMLLNPADKEMAIVGFQCSNADRAVIGMFDADSDVIAFDYEPEDE